jgi:glycosyltransferase involved in cell wall biosynthesis
MAAEYRWKISEEDRKKFHIPRLGIIFAAKNPDGIAITLDSILKQDFNDFEILASIPPSGPAADIIQEYAAKDKRIRIFLRPEHETQEQYINWSLLVSRSEYIASARQGIIYQQDFNAQISFLDKYRNVGILLGDNTEIKDCTCCDGPVIMRRRVIETVGSLIEPTFFEKALEKFKISIG